MPWTAGTGIDLWHRAMAEAAAKSSASRWSSRTRPGASGTAGPAAMAATAKPDGYTISHIPITIVRFPFMQKVTWDPLKDFTYIIHLSGFLFGVVVRADSPFKTFKDMIEFARSNPGKVTYGSPGAGTSLHIGMEQIALRDGVKFTHVPFKGGSRRTAVLGGHVMAIPKARAGGRTSMRQAMRVLVLWTEARNPRLPDTCPRSRRTAIPSCSTARSASPGRRAWIPPSSPSCTMPSRPASRIRRREIMQKRYDYVDALHGQRRTYTRFVAEQVAEQKDVSLGIAKV